MGVPAAAAAASGRQPNFRQQAARSAREWLNVNETFRITPNSDCLPEMPPLATKRLLPKIARLQQATITQLESKVAKQEVTATQQQKQIEALTATIQKVSDQLALSKPAPQLVANP
jgi:uncharacterized coiled-coil protein SlyX